MARTCSVEEERESHRIDGHRPLGEQKYNLNIQLTGLSADMVAMLARTIS